MKKIFILVAFIMSSLSANTMIHPLDFKNTDIEKKKVMKYIVTNVKEKYTSIGMGSASSLRMMEKNELESFKYLTGVKNRKLLDDVISKYCSIGMCSYNTIKMMYSNEIKASKEKLSW